MINIRHVILLFYIYQPVFAGCFSYELPSGALITITTSEGTSLANSVFLFDGNYYVQPQTEVVLVLKTAEQENYYLENHNPDLAVSKALVELFSFDCLEHTAGRKEALATSTLSELNTTTLNTHMPVLRKTRIDFCGQGTSNTPSKHESQCIFKDCNAVFFKSNQRARTKHHKTHWPKKIIDSLDGTKIITCPVTGCSHPLWNNLHEIMTHMGRKHFKQFSPE